MVNEQALLSDLVAAIQTWLQGSRSRSLSSLARRTNVAYSTIRRIAQNESVPHPYTALAIAEVIMSVPQRIDFLKQHFPTIGNLMNEVYDSRMQSEPNDEEFRRFMKMEPHNRIFNIAATNAGTTRADILRLFGQTGEEAVQHMLNEGLLVELPSGTIKYTQDSWIHPSVEDTLSQIRHSTEHFDKTLIGTDGASLMHATGSIRPEMVPRLKALVLQFIKDVIELKEQENAVGGVHFFCDMVYSLYDKREWNPFQEQDG
jgi:transcriptional regulator with XRE-family HTH domain